MSNTEKPAWLDQVQQFQSDDRALKATQGEDVTQDPEAVGAALAAIADGMDKPADAVVIGGQVYVRAGGFKQLPDGRNLPVFIAEGHPDAREQGEARSTDPAEPGAQALFAAGAFVKRWIREHQTELNSTEFARIDAALERLMMQLGMAAASEARTVPDEFLAICREELVRGTLTSLPLKVAFAKQRGMTFEQVDAWMRETRRAFRAAVEAAGGPVPEVTQLANKYLVLRSVVNNSAKLVELPAAARERKVHRVWLLYDEAKFVAMGKPAHHVNAFLDDRGHDWALVQREGKTYLRYYAHSSAKGDVVDVLVEFEE